MSGALGYLGVAGIDFSLEALFNRAREMDEFEYVCTLLRIRGLEDPGWDPLVESRQLSEDMLSTVAAPVRSAFRMRLLLLLYCHVTEMDDLYSIPANMLRVVAGERCVMSPFDGSLSPDGKAADKPFSKARRVRELALASGFQDVAELYNYFLINRVRNAFFHSTYTLTQDAFHVTTGPGVTIDRVTSQRVPWDWLLPRMETAINLSLHIFDLLSEHRRAYRANKIVLGRIGQNGELLDVELIAGEQGLLGFQSPGSSARPST